MSQGGIHLLILIVYWKLVNAILLPSSALCWRWENLIFIVYRLLFFPCRHLQSFLNISVQAFALLCIIFFSDWNWMRTFNLLSSFTSSIYSFLSFWNFYNSCVMLPGYNTLSTYLFHHDVYLFIFLHSAVKKNLNLIF